METQNKKDCMDILGTSGDENRIDQVRGWGKKALGETTRIWELFRDNVQTQYYRHSENFTKYILGKIPFSQDFQLRDGATRQQQFVG